MELIITDRVKREEEQAVMGGVMEYNRERFEKAGSAELGIYLKEESGEIAAGLTGYTHGEWLHIKWLWVSGGLRGKHVGRRILQEAETEAKARGCRHSFLDTFEFQAPGFYRKYGYKEIFVLEEHPETGKHYYMTKEL